MAKATSRKSLYVLVAEVQVQHLKGTLHSAMLPALHIQDLSLMNMIVFADLRGSKFFFLVTEFRILVTFSFYLSLTLIYERFY